MILRRLKSIIFRFIFLTNSFNLELNFLKLIVLKIFQTKCYQYNQNIQLQIYKEKFLIRHRHCNS